MCSRGKRLNGSCPQRIGNLMMARLRVNDW